MVQQKLWQETLWDTCSRQEFGSSAASSVFSPSQGVKVLPLFTPCFCCRPGCESGAPLTQFTLAGCECLLRAAGCGQVCPGPFLHSFSIVPGGWHGWMARPWKILSSPRERWSWAVPKGSQAALRGKLNKQLGETPWALHKGGSRNLHFWEVHLRTFPYISALALGFQPSTCLCAIHSAT